MSIPPTSPRLPSPPPPTEYQLGPPSPSRALSAGSSGEIKADRDAMDRNITRRVRPGTKSADFACGPPLIPFSEVWHYLYLASATHMFEHALT